MHEAGPGPGISVVVASVEAGRTLGACLSSVAESLDELGEASAQVLVLDASGNGSADVVRRDFPHVLVETFPRGTLVPALWARGIELAAGRVIALTTGHCTVPRGWIRALTESLTDEVVGAGGPLRLAPGAGIVDWAVYLLRYSAFLPDAEAGAGVPADGEAGTVRPAPEIPADNAAYRAEDLRRHSGMFRDGFWEVPFHRALREEGKTLAWVPGAAVHFGPAWPLGTILRHRYAHGRHFGRWRVVEAGQSRLRVMAAAPLVPWVLALRTAGRTATRPGLLLRLLASSPWFLLLAGGWALGEAVGAWNA